MNQILIKSLCWTFVHSLWQGLAIAVLASLIIMFTRKSSSVKRYNLLLLAGVLFLATTAATFYNEVNKNIPVTHHHEPSLAIGQGSPVLVIQNHDFQQQRRSVLQSVAGFLTNNSQVIMLCWFLIFMFKLTSFSRSLFFIGSIRRVKPTGEMAYWQQQVNGLCTRLNIRKHVRMVETKRVHVPSVVGYFKPVIFVPVGFLANIGAAEAEAILLHELAHIVRKDYVVHLIQHVVETVFFFNPAVMWLSSLINTERENCCDDFAVAVTGNKVEYVRALVATGSFSLEHTNLALAFGKQKEHLLDRSKRILTNSNKTLNTMEKTIITTCILLTTGVLFAFSGVNHVDSVSPVSKVDAVDEVSVLDSLDPLAPLAPLSAVDIVLPDSSKNKKQITEKETKEALEKQMQEMEKAMEEMNKAMKELENAQVNMENIDWSKLEAEMKQAENEMKKTDWAKMEIELQKAEEEMKKINWDDINEQMRLAELEMAKVDWKSIEDEMKQAEIEMKNAQAEMEKARIEMKHAEKEMKKFEVLKNKILTDLKNDMHSDDIGSFKLDSEEFIVNGQKQDAQMHSRYSKKYLEKGHSIYYNYTYKGNTITGSGIEK
ncbi:MAG TPA: M56 family metallopeptidase [Flavobacteriales bacterium]|nr:M56 family metallopeptidase [Flavobacteriales bacterium]